MSHDCPVEDCNASYDSKKSLNGHLGSHKKSEYKDPVPCTTCGGDIYMPPSRIERKDHYFCSDSCENEWRSENFSGKNSPVYSQETVYCSWCGESKKETQSRIERNNKFFCDRDCRSSWESENWVGEDSPRWSGGRESKYYGPNWTEKRKEIIERDSNSCKRCRRTKEEQYSEFKNSLVVHHITPLETFDGDYESANERDNLVTLCSVCHPKMENLSPSEQRELLFGDNK